MSFTKGRFEFWHKTIDFEVLRIDLSHFTFLCYAQNLD